MSKTQDVNPLIGHYGIPHTVLHDGRIVCKCAEIAALHDGSKKRIVRDAA